MSVVKTLNVVKTLREKPWLVTSEPIAKSAVDSAQHQRLALTMFLVVITVVFSLFIVTLLARSQYPDFRPLAEEVWQPFFDTSRLWINTGILISCSLCFELARICLRREKFRLAQVALAGAWILTLQFLLAQYMLWQYLDALGFSVESNPANSYFYLLTALHGIHLIGGWLVLSKILVTEQHRDFCQRGLNTIHLCARYWHYLALLWLALFALLTASPHTYQTLAALCGY